MSFSDRTKQIFASALRDLLQSRSLHQIRVSALCRHCGAERQTFYYHFKDKYDLASWIYEQDHFRAMKKASGILDLSYLEALLQQLWADRDFYCKVFADTEQNALLPYVRQRNIHLAETLLKQRLQIDTLSDEQKFSIQFLSRAWHGCLVDWCKGAYPIPAAQLAQWMSINIQHLWETSDAP